MSILNWPAEDRPREKLLLKGEKALTNAELIAILLQSGRRGKTALDLARELLQEHGSLRNVLRASAQTLLSKTGMGKAKYAMLKAAIEIGRRYFNEPLPVGTVLDSSRLSQQFLVSHLRDQPNEIFACIFLDQQLRLLSYEELFHGTINEANIYPREIVRRSLLHNAAKIILAHNHPSGNPAPGQADKTITLQIKELLQLIDVTTVDHIIIGNPDNYSFADAGLL